MVSRIAGWTTEMIWISDAAHEILLASTIFLLDCMKCCSSVVHFLQALLQFLQPPVLRFVWCMFVIVFFISHNDDGTSQLRLETMGFATIKSCLQVLNNFHFSTFFCFVIPGFLSHRLRPGEGDPERGCWGAQEVGGSGRIFPLRWLVGENYGEIHMTTDLSNGLFMYGLWLNYVKLTMDEFILKLWLWLTMD